MDKNKAKRLKWLKRKRRVRKKIYGTPERPRLTVYKSLRHIYAQIIDDSKGYTLVSASTLTPDLRSEISGLKKVEQAKKVGALIAKKAIEKGIKQVVFDRNGYIYHGRVSALAEGAREGGLDF